MTIEDAFGAQLMSVLTEIEHNAPVSDDLVDRLLDAVHETLTPSSRPHRRHARLMPALAVALIVVIAGVLALAASFNGDQHDIPPGRTSSTGPSSRPSAQPSTLGTLTPSVLGEQAARALVQLHRSGFRTIRFNAAHSDEAVGTIVAQHPQPHAYVQSLTAIVLTMSAGPHPPQSILVPGVGTCEMANEPPRSACIGGPVMAKLIGSHRRHR